MTDQLPDTTTAAPPLARRAAHGVMWATAQKWIVRISGLLTIAIVARHLAPADFGLMAIATSVMPIIYLLADFGFTTYLVQLENTPRKTLSTAFWYSAAAGVVLAAALAGVGTLIGEMIGIAGVGAVLLWLSPAVVFAATAAVPTAILRRRMSFRALALQAFVAAVIGQAVAISIAVLGGGVWALVAQLAVTQVVTFILVWISAKWAPGFEFSTAEFSRMLRFGVSVVGVDAVALLRSWGETAIIASTLGIANLGIYSISQRLIQVAQDLSSAAIAPVSTVAFAQVRSTPDRLRGGYLRALSLSYAVVIPVMIVIVVSADEIVPIMFGPQWSSSVAPARVLAVAGVLTAGAMLDHGLFYGMGKPARWLVYSAAVDAVTVLATAIAVGFGLAAVAVGFVVVAALATVIRWFLVARLLAIRPRRVAAPFVTIALAGTIAGLGGWGIHLASDGLPDLLGLTFSLLTTGVLYVGGLRMLAPSTFRELWSYIPLRRAKIKGRTESETA